MIKKTLKIAIYSATVMLCVLALLLSTARLLTLRLEQEQPKIETIAQKTLGLPVHIKTMHAYWYGFSPVLEFAGVQIEGSKENLLSADRITVQIDVLRSLWKKTLQPRRMLFSDVKINVPPKEWEAYMRQTSLKTPHAKPTWLPTLLGWLLHQQEVVLKNVEIVLPHSVPALAESQFSLVLENTGDQHRLYGKIQLLHAPQSNIQVIANLHGKNQNIAAWKGQVYLRAETPTLALFNPYLPIHDLNIKEGQLDLQVWGTFKKGLLHAKEGLWLGKFNLGQIKVHHAKVSQASFLFSKISSVVSVKKVKDTWHVVSDPLLISTPILSSTTRFHLTLPNERAQSAIRLNTDFSIVNFPKIKALFPDRKMGPKLFHWLNQSLIGQGTATGSLVWQGDFTHFPYEKGGGLFLVNSDFENMSLNYREGWPRARAIKAHVTFKGRDAMAQVSSGILDDVPIKNVALSIHDLGHDTEVLHIAGKLETDLNNGRQFILNSPLKKKLSFFETMKLKGPMILNMGIDIPLYPGNHPNLVTGDLQFLSDSLFLPEWWNLHLEQMKGTLSFDQTGIQKSKYTATLLGYPFAFTMKTVHKPQTQTVVGITGIAGIDLVQKLFHLSLLKQIQGKTPIRATLNIGHGNLYDELQVNSDLKGVNILLPPPFAKLPPIPHDFSLNAKFGHHNAYLIIEDKNLLDLHEIFDKTVKGYQLRSGNITVGPAKASFAQDRTLTLTGELPSFPLQSWWPIIQSWHTNTNDAFPPFKVSKLVIKQAEFLGQEVPHLTVFLQKNQTQWDMILNSDKIDGKILFAIPFNAGIQAQLNHLYWEKSKKIIQKKTDLTPMDVPPLQVNIDDFHYGDLRLGQLILKTTTEKNTLTIKQCTVRSATHTLYFQGSWQKTNGIHQTKIQGTSVSNNLAATLSEWNIHPVVQAKSSKIDFNLFWYEAPQDFALSELNGSTGIKIEHGVITELDKKTEEKIGLGKLLSILSLQTLPRRLTLDFSDLSTKGFSFDIFKGNFNLKEGNMTTTDSYLDGPVAYVYMQGSLHLSKKYYDLLLKVEPHVTASLPIVATIAGGPVVGIAALVVDTLLTQSMKKVSGYTYFVTGPWAKPNIEQKGISPFKKQ